MNRRTFIKWTGRGAAVVALGGIAARAGRFAEQARPIWVIDYDKCTACGKCETACVRRPSAVKAVNDKTICSNCFLCYGHTTDHMTDTPDTAEKVCPVDAVIRTQIGESSNYIYSINDDLCIGCGKCVKDCVKYGNKSMFLVIRPKLCLGCNECNLARVCPDDAITRVESAPILESKSVEGEQPLSCRQRRRQNACGGCDVLASCRKARR